MTPFIQMRCMICGNVFVQKAPLSQSPTFCPRCGRNVAAEEVDQQMERSSGAMTAVVLGGCFIGLMLLMMTAVGGALFFTFRLSLRPVPPVAVAPAQPQMFPNLATRPQTPLPAPAPAPNQPDQSFPSILPTVPTTPPTAEQEPAAPAGAGAIAANDGAANGPLPGAAPVPAPGAVPMPLAAPRLNDDEISNALADAINPSANLGTRVQALQKLSTATPVDIRRAEIVQGMAPLASDANLLINSTALRVIGNWAGKEQVPVLLKLLDEVQSSTRFSVYQALEKVPDERIAAALAQKMLIREEQGTAMQALRKQGPLAEQAILAVLTEHHDEHHTTFLFTIVLRDVGGAKSVEVLKTLLAENPAPPIRSVLESALRQIERKPAQP